MALAEIDRAIAAGVRFGCALADAGSGLSASFRNCWPQSAARRRGRWWRARSSRSGCGASACSWGGRRAIPNSAPGLTHSSRGLLPPLGWALWNLPSSPPSVSASGFGRTSSPSASDLRAVDQAVHAVFDVREWRDLQLEKGQRRSHGETSRARIFGVA